MDWVFRCVAGPGDQAMPNACGGYDPTVSQTFVLRGGIRVSKSP